MQRNDQPKSTLTLDEMRAIDTLKRLANRWPRLFWLFVADGDFAPAAALMAIILSTPSKSRPMEVTSGARSYATQRRKSIEVETSTHSAIHNEKLGFLAMMCAFLGDRI